MSQRAIKKRTKDSFKKPAVKIQIEPLDSKSRRSPGPLPQKSFPLNKFIALPNGLRPKSGQNSVDESPRRNIPIKAVAVPSGTSLSDSRASVYVIASPEATSNVTSEAFATSNSPDHVLHNNITLPGQNTIVNRRVNRASRSEKPDATSTPRVPRRSEPRGYYSAQNSPRSTTPHGSVNSNESFTSGDSRKRRYQKRSQSAPAENRRRLLDTDYVIKKWSEYDQIPGLIHKIPRGRDSDGVSIISENWSSAKVGIYPNGVVRTIYRSNSVNSGHSVNSLNTSSIGSSRSISELEFTDVCKVNPTFHDNNIEANNVSVQNWDFVRSDTHGNRITSVNSQSYDDIKWEDISGLNYRRTIQTEPQQIESGHKLYKSLSDYNLDSFNMEVPERTRRMSQSSIATSVGTTRSAGGGAKSFTVNGIPQSGIVIRTPGKEKVFVNDYHSVRPVTSNGQEFYTVGRKSGTLMQSKLKFSSMPTLLDSKGDKKLLKLLKKQEKEEKKRREKEEKKRAKEEKKRLKMEKKLKTKTLPRNFQYQNGNILSPAMDSVYRRPMLSLSAVPIDIEDGQASSTGSTHTQPPNMAPPPLPEPSQRTMSLYASAPDLLRLEQVYGATLRGTNKDNHYRPPIPTSSDYGPRTVVLQRATEGYGFVLRGAKSQLKPSGELDFRPTAEFPALQYLDSVDPGSVSDRAGLKGGDFILEINGENVVRASHDRVVHLIRSTGDTLAMKVVTVKPANRSQDWFMHQDKSMTMPNRKKKAAPAPPQRDPRTSLSMSRSEGQAISDEMAAMDKLDEAIQSQREVEEKKTASIRSRTAAKRVSCVDMDNIGIDGKLEKSKSRSTPDLLDNESKSRKNIIYATPTVPDMKSSDQKNVYTVQVGNAPSSPTGVQIRPKGPPPPPPEETNSPKKKAPKPPKSDSGDSSSSEVISINTNKQSPYASVKVFANKVDSPDSPYESSFRPGASAKLSEEPNEGSGHKPGHQRTPSAGAALVKESDKQNVSFAEDKVLDHAAGFLKKHPNAKLLITAEGKDKLKKRNLSLYEPEPDYDSDSGEEKPDSLVKMRDPKKQSVTVISVGEKASVAQPQTKRYTIHTSIPSEEKGFVIPPRPDGPAPAPPVPGSQSPKQKKSAAPAPPKHSSQVMTVKAEVNVESFKRQQEVIEIEAPPLPETPPPDFETTPSPRQAPPPPVAPPPPAVGPPPPPPPPPPAPSYDQIVRSKSVVKADYIAPVPVPTDAIAAAVAKRQERMQNEGAKITEQKPKPPSPANVKDSNQAAILAAVAKRREKLEQQGESSVIDNIESRLQKTKKLQAAKFQLAGVKTTKTDTKTNNNTNGTSQNKLNFKVQSTANKTGPVKKEAPAKEEFSFKVKPVNVSGLTEIKPKFTPKPLSSTNVKQTIVTNSAKVSTQESLKIKPNPYEKSTTVGVVKPSDSKNNTDNKTVDNSEKINNEKNVNGQSDYIALAEKRRQEWLQRKQKSSESKSSTPEKEKLQTKTIEIKSVNKSPPVSVKPKAAKNSEQSYTEYQSSQGLVKVKALTNGNIDKNGTTTDYNNVPPPPPGFRDGGNVENTVVQLEIIPPPANFSSDSGTDMSHQHSPAFSPDTASLVSSLSTLSSLSGDGRGNGYDDVIAPPPPGFDDGDSSVIPPPPEFGNDNGGFKKTGKTYNDKPVDQWLCNDVLDWLDSLSMSQYKPSFQSNCIDGKKLVALSRNNYIDLGVTQVGHRMNIERSIKKAAIRQNNVSDNILASERL